MNLARADKGLLLCLSALLALGVVMIYSTSSFYAQERFGDQFYFLKRHLCFLALAVPAAFCFFRLRPEKMRRLSFPLLLLSLFLLLATLAFGTKVSGSMRWLRLGPLAFQPAELTKLALIVFLAHFLARRREQSRSFRSLFLPVAMIAGICILPILLQPDFGTAVFLALLTALMLFVAGSRLRYLAVTLLLAAPALYALVFSTPYRRRRILAFLDPWADPQNTGFQIIQSFIAFRQGGLLGVGLGDSHQKMFFLPEAHTDFVFSVIAEELGFVGVAAVILLFVFLCWRGLRTALAVGDLFQGYLAFGLTLGIGLQALINMGVASGCLPTKGLTLPFLSYGGTSLMSCLIMGAILLNLSAQAGNNLRVSGGVKT